ncbi:MAG: cupredoxin family copper-binding protein [Rhodospirillales bacterium]
MSRMTRAVLAGACLLPHHLPAAPALSDAVVTIDNFAFTTPVTIVTAGTTITWTNRDDIPHTVTADDGPPPTYRSHPLDTGDQFSMLFAKPGTYRYFCSLHPKMRGTVIVR